MVQTAAASRGHHIIRIQETLQAVSLGRADGPVNYEGMTMPTIKMELSKKNPYHLSKYRMYELKYFCLQYPEWKQEYNDLETRISQSWNGETVCQNALSRPVEELVLRREDLARRMRLVEESAQATDEVIGWYIFKAVTDGLSFTKVKMVYEIPCEADMWYNRWRKFFFILNSRKLQRV